MEFNYGISIQIAWINDRLTDSSVAYVDSKTYKHRAYISLSRYDWMDLITSNCYAMQFISGKKAHQNGWKNKYRNKMMSPGLDYFNRAVSPTGNFMICSWWVLSQRVMLDIILVVHTQTTTRAQCLHWKISSGDGCEFASRCSTFESVRFQNLFLTCSKSLSGTTKKKNRFSMAKKIDITRWNTVNNRFIAETKRNEKQSKQ